MATSTDPGPRTPSTGTPSNGPVPNGTPSNGTPSTGPVPAGPASDAGGPARPGAPRPGARPAALPGRYLLWLGGVQVGLLGDAALYFALGWAASAHGGGAAGLVLTAITLPRTALVLLGGAVADRFGARRVMLAGDTVMLAATLVLAGPRPAGTSRSGCWWPPRR
ncbi:hypothetical protein ACFQ0M_24235 [Kitasatospora aburaviensis]